MSSNATTASTVSPPSACGVGSRSACSAGDHRRDFSLDDPTILPPNESRWTTMFGIDTRSLAALRIGLGLILLADLFNRSRHLTAFYTDAGMLPRSVVAQDAGGSLRVSLHMLSGHPLVMGVLFAVAAVFAAMMTVGWRTRLATCASWLLLISLHNRTSVVLQGGDTILRAIMFWAMFLPLGVRCSVDAALNTNHRPQPRVILSAATVAILVQLALMYVVTALFKNHPVWFERGDAVWMSLQLDRFTTPAGAWLGAQPVLCRWLTHATMVLEWLGPLVAFAPFMRGWVRFAAVLAFMGFHVGLMVTFHLGLFPVICMVAWLAFVPSSFWDVLARRASRRPALTIHYDRDCAFCRTMVALVRAGIAPANTFVRTAQSDPRFETIMRERDSWSVARGAMCEADPATAATRFDAFVPLLRSSPLLFPLAPIAALGPVRLVGNAAYSAVARRRSEAARAIAFLKPRAITWGLPRPAAALVVVLLGAVVLHNYERLTDRLPTTLEESIMELTRLDQMWSMFAPYPSTSDGWWVIVGTLEDGREIDLFNHRDIVTFEKPAYVAAQYPTQRWRKFLDVVSRHNNPALNDRVAEYFARRYNEAHPEGPRVVASEPIYVQERTRPLGLPARARPVAFGHWPSREGDDAVLTALVPDEE